MITKSRMDTEHWSDSLDPAGMISRVMGEHPQEVNVMGGSDEARRGESTGVLAKKKTALTTRLEEAGFEGQGLSNALAREVASAVASGVAESESVRFDAQFELFKGVRVTAAGLFNDAGKRIDGLPETHVGNLATILTLEVFQSGDENSTDVISSKVDEALFLQPVEVGWAAAHELLRKLATTSLNELRLRDARSVLASATRPVIIARAGEHSDLIGNAHDQFIGNYGRERILSLAESSSPAVLRAKVCIDAWRVSLPELLKEIEVVIGRETLENTLGRGISELRFLGLLDDLMLEILLNAEAVDLRTDGSVARVLRLVGQRLLAHREAAPLEPGRRGQGRNNEDPVRELDGMPGGSEGDGHPADDDSDSDQEPETLIEQFSIELTGEADDPDAESYVGYDRTGVPEENNVDVSEHEKQILEARLEGVKQELLDAVAGARNVLASSDKAGHRKALRVLDCVNGDGEYDVRRVLEARVEYESNGSGQLGLSKRDLEKAEREVHRAYERLRTELAPSGFVLLEDSSPRHLGPPTDEAIEAEAIAFDRVQLTISGGVRSEVGDVLAGAAEAFGEGSAACIMVELEIEGGTIAEVIEEVNGSLPGKDVGIDECGEYIALVKALKGARRQVRKTILVTLPEARFFYESPIDPTTNRRLVDVPPSLRVRADASDAPGAHPAALRPGRLIAAGKDAIPVERKYNDPAVSVGLLPDLPTPLIKRHNDRWWYFAEKGVGFGGSR